MDIVYRKGLGSNGWDSVVFAERSRAERVAQIRDAIEQSSTWGEFRRALPEEEWENIFLTYFEDEEQEPPADDAAFDPDCVPGFIEGDYPDWLRQVQLDWFPKELIEKYGGEISLTVHDGPTLDLPGDKAEQIADDLRTLGHTVERSDLNFELS